MSLDLDNPGHHEPRGGRQMGCVKMGGHMYRFAGCTFSFRNFVMKHILARTCPINVNALKARVPLIHWEDSNHVTLLPLPG